MSDLSAACTHPFFDFFMDSRKPGLPSDFECYMLDAILAMPVNASEAEPGQAPAIEPIHASKPVPRTLPDEHTLVFGYSADKLFPVQLLKCPLPIFVKFVKERGLHPNLVEALRNARRRKVNRKLQRITRNRRRGFKSCCEEESDDEGACSEINFAAVHAHLVAALKAISLKGE